MSGATAAVEAPRAREAAAPARHSTALALTAFGALALWATGHWNGLVEAAPVGRTLLVVIVSVAGAAALARLGARRPTGRTRHLIAAAIALFTLLAGLAAAGLPVKLLLPGGWEELVDGLDRGLGGIQNVAWPYDGDDDWVRLSILLGAPLLLSIAAALSFWPADRARPALRAEGLVALLVLYGMAVTEHDPGEPLLRGLVLLGLVAAFLWLPSLPPREGVAGGVAVAAAGIAALPLAAALDGDSPWWDYRAWNWFGGGEAVTFNWNHRYGPLDWPRDGTTLLNVESSRPHYWKTETLDRFDGVRWLRSRDGDSLSGSSDLPARLAAQGPTWEPFEFNPRWDQRIRVTVRALRSNLLVGPGTTYAVRGAGPVSASGDGTTRRNDTPLERGDSYVVRGYAPDPTAAQMRAAPGRYPESLVRYTGIQVRRPGRTLEAIYMPLRGDPVSGSAGASERLASSPYAPVARLTRRITAGAATPYDAVKSVERHLRRGYRYSEQPPARTLPLRAFLFRDKIGYCQQFSGAMALMLRTAGIPARVATGFSPGSFNRDSGEYRVRDLDAHSWVEVHFTGIGWVPFDPTPDASPAEAQSAGSGADSAASAFGRDSGSSDSGGDSGGDEAAAAGREPSDSGPVPLLLAVLLGLALLALAGGFAVARLRGRAGGGDLADAQLVELRRALERLDWRLSSGTTLLALERRLARAAGPASARYSARLREQRYSPRRVDPPGMDERRRVRRELASAAGLRGRLRALLAMPPWGPGRI